MSLSGTDIEALSKEKHIQYTIHWIYSDTRVESFDDDKLYRDGTTANSDQSLSSSNDTSSTTMQFLSSENRLPAVPGAPLVWDRRAVLHYSELALELECARRSFDVSTDVEQRFTRLLQEIKTLVKRYTSGKRYSKYESEIIQLIKCTFIPLVPPCSRD